MKKLKNSILFLGVAAFLASCSASGPLMVTNNAIGSKRGEASVKIRMFTFKHIDLGCITAAKKGGIKTIATVDWKKKGKTISTIVTGE